MMTTSQDQMQGSVLETFLKTVVLVGLTVALMALVRFWGPLARGVSWVAGSGAWQRLYTMFKIESGLGREQLILVGIALSCFLVALVVQSLLWLVVRRIRARG